MRTWIRLALVAALVLALAAVYLKGSLRTDDDALPPAPPGLAAELHEEAARRAAAAEEEERMTVVGSNGWLFLGAELRHLGVGEFWGREASAVSRVARPEHADPLPAILDFKEQLDQLGVELLVVPVPPKSVVYPDALLDDFTVPAGEAPPRLDPLHQRFYEELERQGIEVLDLTPLFLENRHMEDGALYCRQDSHWSGHGTVLAARAITERLAGRSWLDDQERLPLEHEWRTLEINGDLRRGLDRPPEERERLRVRSVGHRVGESLTPLDPEPESPIVLLGDSHNLVFHAGGDMHGRGAGLPDQLALELGFPVDLVAVRGSGATPARINLLRRAQRDPDYWDRKRLVLWLFSAREFTESDGWREVPITP